MNGQISKRSKKLAKEKTNLGFTLYEAGKYEEAIKLHNEAMKRNPNFGKPYNNRAACYIMLEQLELALKDCDKCIELDPLFRPAHLNRAYIFERLEDFEEALYALLAAHDIRPLDLEFKKTLAQHLVTVYNLSIEVREKVWKNARVQAILDDQEVSELLRQMKADDLENGEFKIQKIVVANIMSFLPYFQIETVVNVDESDQGASSEKAKVEDEFLAKMYADMVKAKSEYEEACNMFKRKASNDDNEDEKLPKRQKIDAKLPGNNYFLCNSI